MCNPFQNDYIFDTQQNALEKYNLISCDTITNVKQKLIMWHILNKNKERKIILANTSIGKLTPLERCVAEVTTITQNATTVSFQYDDVVDNDELSQVQRGILIQLLQHNSNVFGEKITENGRTNLVQNYIDVGIPHLSIINHAD